MYFMNCRLAGKIISDWIKMNKLILLTMVFLFSFCPLAVAAGNNAAPDIAIKGMVTLVDVSFKDCHGCQKMLPIIEKLKKDYSGKIGVVFVDFWKQAAIVKEIGTNTAPTILVYDKDGKEVFRNYGPISEQELIFVLKATGAPI
jgi:thiol-disulfide isomerase/thioredoxin